MLRGHVRTAFARRPDRLEHGARAGWKFGERFFERLIERRIVGTRAVACAFLERGRTGDQNFESVRLGLDRLVRVSQEFTYTARQLEGLRAKLAVHFARKPTMNVAEFKEISGVSRKYAVPLLEHSDRVGWTARSGDERKAGGRL